MEQNEIVVFQQSIETCEDPAETARKVSDKVHGRTVGKRELAFVDCHGNNLLWYLTYRDDRNAAGGFACPKTVAALLERGVDPSRRNILGLCWNDVARHVVRPEVRG